MNNAEAGLLKRAATRYLVPKNHEASIRRHELVGTHLFRKLIMSTVGRIVPAYSGGNYRLNGRQGKLESANNFAFKGSVFNELVHAVQVPINAIDVMHDVADGNINSISNVAALAINVGCVAVQRYNRARMVGVVDRAVQRGREFDPDYRSWTGIDNRAIDNFYDEPVCIEVPFVQKTPQWATQEAPRSAIMTAANSDIV
jgi:hypothetical protein